MRIKAFLQPGKRNVHIAHGLPKPTHLATCLSRIELDIDYYFRWLCHLAVPRFAASAAVVLRCLDAKDAEDVVVSRGAREGKRRNRHEVDSQERLGVLGVLHRRFTLLVDRWNLVLEVEVS